jgi:DNA-binding beta-propeller fold protein YncE
MMASSRSWQHDMRSGCTLALALCALWGCDSNDSPKTVGTDDAVDAGPEGGKPREMGGALPEANAPPLHIAANNAEVRAPMDATPSPDAAKVYYTALSREDGTDTPGVFSVAADGSNDVAKLAVGDELTAPVGITVSLDGEALYVADTAAGEAEGGATGALISVSPQDGTLSILKGTEGYAPKGLVIAAIKGKEQLVFSGTDPKTGQGGVFRIAPAGGSPTPIAPDVAIGDPGGVAVAPNGDVYVVDALSSEGGASLLRLRDGEPEVVARGLGVGFPAGTAITQDGGTVLVSGLDPVTHHDVVYLLDTESLDLSMVSKPLAGFTEPAGLHRAHDSNVFAWADSEANDSGTVYVLEL